MSTAAPSGPATEWRTRWTRPAVVANLVAQIAIIGTGGLVRLTGSGLGCSTWPQCQPGSFVPVRHAASPLHQSIEFGNRTLTGVLVAIAVAVLVLVGLNRRHTAGTRALGWVPLVLVLVQAVVGGLSVIGGLPPAVVGLHFLLSMLLVVAATWLLVRIDEGDGPMAWRAERATVRWAVAQGVLTFVVLVLGVVTTGAGPHSGDDAVGYRFAVDPLLMARAHAGAVWAFIAVSVVLLLRVRRAGGAPRRWAVTVLVVAAAQGGIGYVQVATGLPIALVNLHMIGAALLAAAVTRFATTLRRRQATNAPSPDATPFAAVP
ncbi:MAG: COX15/CtaA family protein [Actinobacteria bacterium]|nr:COX15/CtaA family protein [Actinomycetota bacterium]MCG2801514.1 COX15/CtaA family protein [Cellulomonas sp.]